MIRPKRILQIMGSLDMGGAETMIMNIYREIDKNKIQFDFFISDPKVGFYENEAKELGARIFRSKTKSRHPVKYSKDLKKIIVTNKYDTVHVHATNAYATLPLLVAKKAGVKNRICHSHNSQGINKNIQSILRLCLNRQATIKISCSDLAANWMYGKNSSDYLVINNPIDVRKFRYNETKRELIREKLGIKNEKVYIHVGRFAKQKNHNFIIDIFQEILKIQSDSFLILIGDGYLLEQIKKKVKDYNISRKVFFLGIIDNVQDYLSASDLFMMPSLFEGFPVTLVETQANGLPSILSDKITKQVRLTDLIAFNSLNSDAQIWAKKSVNLTNKVYNRANYTDVVAVLYDSINIAKKIEEIYLLEG